LQQIDMGASNLQKKIEAAQKEGQRVSANGLGGIGGDHADDFMRSYMRR
jgi:nuclear pore complex protein Nup62